MGKGPRFPLHGPFLFLCASPWASAGGGTRLLLAALSRYYPSLSPWRPIRRIGKNGHEHANRDSCAEHSCAAGLARARGPRAHLLFPSADKPRRILGRTHGLCLDGARQYGENLRNVGTRPGATSRGEEMKGHIRERSPGHWAIVIDVRDAKTGRRKRK